jgi:hypothetical protein
VPHSRLGLPARLTKPGRPEQALSGGFPEAKSRQVKLPLVKGDGKRKIDPTREELDASLWTVIFSNSAD